jgi:murein DD-endopeptidase MepM/ murein hydrolase activator NlpD
LTSHRHAHPLRSALATALPRPGWKSAGLLALLCSTVAWASLPRADMATPDEQRQWHALGVAPLSGGSGTGIAMAPTEAVEPVDFVPKRPAPVAAPVVVAKPAAPAVPLRIRGRAGDGLYWSLRAAGASPEVAAKYLTALATQIDVGEVGATDGFDLVLSPTRDLLYAGLDRSMDSDLQLVRWNANGRSEWIDAANAGKPVQTSTGMAWPVAGRITSTFGTRIHPILRFARFHAGVDFGAGWGSPIVATADGQVSAAGWSGGYGRQVRIWHGEGITTTYSHMSEIVASPGSFVRRGQLIGYVGSSGLSTGPHLHYEVLRNGSPVNPLGVRLAGAPVVDTRLAESVKARLKQLLTVGVKRS